MREDVQLLRSLPGVIDATAINAVPLSGGGSASMYYTEPGEKGQEDAVNYFMVDEHGLNALGVQARRGAQLRCECRDRTTIAIPRRSCRR